MSRGHDRERQVKAMLESEGYVVIRAAGSLGVCDLVALRETSFGECEAMLIEVKSTRRKWERFGPADREELLKAAEDAHAEAWLVHWPAYMRAPEWWPSSKWPETKVAA